MIVVNVVIESSAAAIAALQDAIARMESMSRAEPGCDEYTFSVELNNPDILRVTERWETAEALAAHGASAHMAEFRKAMAAHPPKAMKVRYYKAEEFEPQRG
jgi:quinol monooxygenase YgiN